MNRQLFILFLICSFSTGCIKSSDSGLAAAKAQAIVDDKIISDYLAQHPGLNAKRVDAATTDTVGVYYVIKQAGTGTSLFTNSTRVTVADTGRILTSGQVFTQTNDFHPSYVLSEVIRGWQLGIPLCQKGGVVRLLIPSRYAYGPTAQPTIGLPANAVLDFDIQLYDVTN